MKSLLISLFVIATAFAIPQWVEEENSPCLPPTCSSGPYVNDDPMIATEQATPTPLVQDVFEAGRTYLILGSNNKFLSVINYSGVAGVNDYIQSVKNQQDVFCRFVASTLYNGKIALTAVARGMYLQLMHGKYI